MTEKKRDTQIFLKGAGDFEIVVAHYNEDLSWLHPLAEKATVYCKGKLTVL
jgi:hypothetical protein